MLRFVAPHSLRIIPPQNHSEKPLNDTTRIDPHLDQAEILVQALPHMLRYDEATVVVKYGGHAMGDEQVARDFARDMVLLEQSGVNPVVVHGGGPQIGAMLKRLGIKSEFAGRPARHRQGDRRGRRDGAGRARSTSRSSATSTARAAAPSACAARTATWSPPRKVTRTVVDPDQPDRAKSSTSASSASPRQVDRRVLDALLGREVIPVLAPVANGADDGQTYNVNADTFAGAIAGALGAKRLLLLTDVPGVLDKNKNLIKELTVDQMPRTLIADGTITGGMIPKVETCIYALEQGVEGVVILDGKVPHAVLLELFTDLGAGTLIHK